MNQVLTHSYQNDTRRADDFYRTPDWCADIGTRIALQHGGHVLDPCAGDGSLMRAVERAGGVALGMEIDEVRANSSGSTFCDALCSGAEWPNVPAILMNPPFSLWQPFVERALQKRAFAVIALLRLGALAGQKRRDWWRRVADSHGVTVHVLSKRPSFTGKGTDGTDYAWVEISRDRSRIGVEWV